MLCMSRRRVILTIVLLMGAGVIGYLALRTRSETLRGGESIVLGDITFGLRHSSRWGSHRALRFRRFLPAALRPIIKVPIGAGFTTPTNTVTVWFLVTDNDRAGRRNLASAYECTLLTADGKEVAMDSLNVGMATGFFGDRRNLCHATFPWVAGDFRLRVQQRVVSSDGTINVTTRRPAGAGMSGARLHPEAAEFTMSF